MLGSFGGESNKITFQASYIVWRAAIVRSRQHDSDMLSYAGAVCTQAQLQRYKAMAPDRHASEGPKQRALLATSHSGHSRVTVRSQSGHIQVTFRSYVFTGNMLADRNLKWIFLINA